MKRLSVTRQSRDRIPTEEKLRLRRNSESEPKEIIPNDNNLKKVVEKKSGPDAFVDNVNGFFRGVGAIFNTVNNIGSAIDSNKSSGVEKSKEAREKLAHHKAFLRELENERNNARRN